MSLVVEDVTNGHAQLFLENLSVLLRNDLVKLIIVEIEVLELDDHGATLVDEIIVFVVVTFDIDTVERSVIVEVIGHLRMVLNVLVSVAVSDLFGVHGGNGCSVSVCTHSILKY